MATKSKKLDYIARGVRLDEEVWGELARLKQQFGSYNKGLRVVLLPTRTNMDGTRKGRGK